MFKSCGYLITKKGRKEGGKEGRKEGRKVKCDHCSKVSNLSNWKEEALKKLKKTSGLQRDSNP